MAQQKKKALRPAARKCFERALELDPKYAWAEYDLACLDAIERKRDSAFGHLSRAMSLGLNDGQHVLRDPDLKTLRQDRRWKLVKEQMRGKGSLAGS